MMGIHALYWIAFVIQIFVFPATISIDARRLYGRIFNTRIDTKIYHRIFYCMAICVIILFIMIIVMG